MLAKFIANPHHPFRQGDFLKTELQNQRWTHFRAAVAFAKLSGVRHVASRLADFSRRGGTTISVGLDHGGSSVEAVSELLEAVGGTGRLWVFKNPGHTFHPKLFLFKNEQAAELLVGSGNLTGGGLFGNYEGAIQLTLDLREASDAGFLADFEGTLDEWSVHRQGLCLSVNSELIALLEQTGELPREADIAREALATARVRASKQARTSPFTGESVPGAPATQRASATAGASAQVERVSQRGAPEVAPPGRVPTLVGACRLVVHGRRERSGKELRAVRTVTVPGNTVDECLANARALGVGGIFEEMAKRRGFVEVARRSVYPPVGLLLAGGISKGFGTLPDGRIVFVNRQHPSGEPVPDHVLMKFGFRPADA